jgi:hypothetical protein
MSALALNAILLLTHNTKLLNLYIPLSFYAVIIDDNTKPKRPRRDRILFAYRYIVDDKEEEDYNWVTLNDMFVHPEEEQFVGCLYDLLATYIGDSVNDLKTPVMQGADLLNKRYKKQ